MSRIIRHGVLRLLSPFTLHNTFFFFILQMLYCSAEMLTNTESHPAWIPHPQPRAGRGQGGRLIIRRKGCGQAAGGLILCSSAPTPSEAGPQGPPFPVLPIRPRRPWAFSSWDLGTLPSPPLALSKAHVVGRGLARRQQAVHQGLETGLAGRRC